MYKHYKVEQCQNVINKASTYKMYNLAMEEFKFNLIYDDENVTNKRKKIL